MTEEQWNNLDRPCEVHECKGTMECVERKVIEQRNGSTTTTCTLVCDTCFQGKVI